MRIVPLKMPLLNMAFSSMDLELIWLLSWYRYNYTTDISEELKYLEVWTRLGIGSAQQEKCKEIDRSFAKLQVDG